MKRQKAQLPELEHLLIDTDVKATISQYLEAVGFNVVFAGKVKVNYHDDCAIIKWARKHKRILVCHDRYKDNSTKIRVCHEIYKHGGHVIQISGSPAQHVLTSVGKVLLHREKWLEFFSNNDGIVLLKQGEMKPMPRSYLIQQIQGIFKPAIPSVNPKSPRPRKVIKKPKMPPPGQSQLPIN